MKYGRFSSKKTGNRWLTSTWNASLSTWLKSGLIVASSVMVDVSPYLTLAPKSPFDEAAPHDCAASLVWFVETVALGITSSTRGWRSSSKTSGACDSNTHCPGAMEGHDHDTPIRLLCRKNSTPMRTSEPPRKPTLCQTQSGDESSFFPVFSASIWMPLGFTNMWYATCPARVESRLSPIQSSFHALSRRVIVVRIFEGSSSKQRNAK